MGENGFKMGPTRIKKIKNIHNGVKVKLALKWSKCVKWVTTVPNIVATCEKMGSTWSNWVHMVFALLKKGSTTPA